MVVEDVHLVVKGYLDHAHDHERGNIASAHSLQFNDLYEFKVKISADYCAVWETNAEGEYSNIFRITNSAERHLRISPRRLVIYRHKGLPSDKRHRVDDYVATFIIYGLLHRTIRRLTEEKLFLHKLGSNL